MTDDALKTIQKRAEEGYIEAEFLFGRFHQTGNSDYGVRQDPAEAIKWYRRAAEQGHLQATNDLAVMYREGRGVPQNYVESHKWLNLAASQIFSDELPEAKEYTDARDAVAKLMTTTQLAEAQQLATEWLTLHPREGTITEGFGYIQ
jgi:TPR repeat protein